MSFGWEILRLHGAKMDITPTESMAEAYQFDLDTEAGPTSLVFCTYLGGNFRSLAEPNSMARIVFNVYGVYGV